MSRTLRYQISDWTQITECLSNNSKNLYLTLSKHLDGNILKDLVIQVNHTNYGVLFAAIIKGSGKLLSTKTEDGEDLPFFTTEQILKELQRFGFYVTYDLKSNLPGEVLSFLATVDNLGYDKITKVVLEPERKVANPNRIVIEKDDRDLNYHTLTLVIKSTQGNEDILEFGTKLSRAKFNEKLTANTIMNVTDEPGLQWDWVTYIANISDILDENIDPTDDFETETDISTSPFHPYPSDPGAPDPDPTHPIGFTVYDEGDVNAEPGDPEYEDPSLTPYDGETEG